MEYNKQQFNSIKNKKVLHKVKKRWVILSVAILGILSTGGLVKNQVHADSSISGNHTVPNSYMASHSTVSLENNNLQDQNLQDRNKETYGNQLKSNINSIFKHSILDNSQANTSLNSKVNAKSQSISSESNSTVGNFTQNQSTVNTESSVSNAKNSQSIPKTITTWAVTNPSQYIKAVIQKANFDSNDRDAINQLLAAPKMTSFAKHVLYHLNNPYISSYLRASSKAFGTFPPLLNSLAYNSSNWPVYRGVAVNTLYGNLYPAYRNQMANDAISSLLQSNVIHPDTKNDLINSISYIRSLIDRLANTTSSLDNDKNNQKLMSGYGMSDITIPNPALMAADNHSTGYTNSDPNISMAFNDDQLVDPLFNQNYHYNDPEGACNDIQTIMPHYNNDKLDYWDVYYLWNPNSNWIGDQWYHAKTKDFVHFYPGVDADDPASIHNAAIPDPDFRYNGSTVNANNPKAGSAAGPSIELDQNNQANPVPWGQVATGSVVHNNIINPNGILHHDQWGNKIEPNAKLAYFSTFVDQTVPDDGIYLAYSNNDQQFHPYQSRPVMSTDTVNLPNGANFRDTYVTTANHNHELVAYVAGDSEDNKPEIYVLTSTNGTQWNWRRNLAIPIGSYLSGSTNNPNIITIDETPHVGQLNGQPILFFGYQHQLAGGQSTGTKKEEGMAYLTGHFNSEGIFQLNDLQSDPFRYFDQGFDNYAGSIVPVGDNSVYLGWLGNWGYSPILDYSAYKKGSMHQGTFTLPRIISWDAANHRVDAYPIEPGNEFLTETGYLYDRHSEIPVTSDGKTVVEFHGPKLLFNINLIRSASNHINVSFYKGRLTISRTDKINHEMNMKKVINNIGIDKLDNVQFYLDNASVEMYIPAVRKFYTILDLDYHKNAPYQIQTDHTSKITEYGFTKQQPKFDTHLADSNEDQLNKIISQITPSLDLFNLRQNIQKDINQANHYLSKARSANGVEANVYTAYANDYEYHAKDELDQYNTECDPYSSISIPTNITNSLVGENGYLYEYNKDGTLDRNQVLSLSPNLKIRFNNNGEGTYFYAQPSSQITGGKLQPGSSLFHQLLTLINDKIKGNPTNEDAFSDLLYRINTYNLPNLETGVSGIPLTANIWSTDAQSPFIHQLLGKLSYDFNILGKSLNLNMFNQISNLLSNSLLKNIWWVGLFAGGPFNFKRVINNLMPNSNFKTLRPYTPYIQAAEKVYNNPKSVAAYDDILTKLQNLLEESSPISQNNTMKQIYYDIDIIGATPGLPEKNRDYCIKLLNLINDETSLNDDATETNDDASEFNVIADSSADTIINDDQQTISNDINIINDNSAAAMSDYPDIDQINDTLNQANTAASNAEQEASIANSPAIINSVNSSKASTAKSISNSKSASISNSIATSNNNSKAYSRVYSASYSTNYFNSVIDNLKLSTNKNTDSLMDYYRDELDIDAMYINDDLHSLNASDAIQKANSASQTASQAYNAYYSAIDFNVNHLNRSQASSNYSHIYSDYYSVNYDNNHIVNSLITNLNNNSSALVKITQNTSTLSSAADEIRFDFSYPTSQGISEADNELSLVNQAVSSAYNVYASVINNEYTSSYSMAYNDEYTANYDQSLVNSISANISQQDVSSKVNSMLSIDQRVINYASQQINSKLQHHKHISQFNFDIISEYIHSVNMAASNAYNIYYNLIHF